MSPNELKERAEAVLSGRSRGYVEDAQVFASALLKMLRDYETVVDNLSSVQARCTDLLLNQRRLKAVIEKIASAGPDERDETVAEALVLAGAVQ